MLPYVKSRALVSKSGPSRIIIVIIKARLQPRLEIYKLYTQGHQQGKQSSKEKENK